MQVALLAFVPFVALAQKSTVRVGCAEDCRVRIDGRSGSRVENRLWEFKDIEPGSRRFEVTGMLDLPLFAGYVDVPAGSAVHFIADSSKRLVKTKVEPLGQAAPAVAAAPPAPSAPPGAPSTPPPPPSSMPPPPTGNSTVHFICPEECNVTIDGRRGERNDYRRWTIRDIPPGLKRVEVQGQLNRPLFSGYQNIPASSELTLRLHDRRLVASDQKPLGPPAESPATAPAGAAAPAPAGTPAPAPAPAASAPSAALAPGQPAPEQPAAAEARLNVRCERPCTIYVDGLRKSSSGQGVTLTVTPGKHGIEAKDQLNHVLGRGSVEVAAGTEVFVMAAKGGVTVTNTRPLSK